MQKKAIHGPTLASLRKVNHRFGGTYYPYFTSEFSSQQFSVFVNTCHRPLVYRKGLLMQPQMEKQLLTEQKKSPLPGEIENHSFVWEPDDNRAVDISPCYDKAEKFFAVSSDILYKNPSFADAVFVRCVLVIDKNAENCRQRSSTHIENNMVFEIDESVRAAAQKIPHESENRPGEHSFEILLYPQDILFLPSLWSASIKPLFGPSQRNDLSNGTNRSGLFQEAERFSTVRRQCVLLCSFTAYKNPIERTGHFSVAEKLTFHGETEQEFLRKKVRKQARWDEINEGTRKIF